MMKNVAMVIAMLVIATGCVEESNFPKECDDNYRSRRPCGETIIYTCIRLCKYKCDLIEDGSVHIQRDCTEYYEYYD